jgi:hypothetical protein
VLHLLERAPLEADLVDDQSERRDESLAGCADHTADTAQRCSTECGSMPCGCPARRPALPPAVNDQTQLARVSSDAAPGEPRTNTKPGGYAFPMTQLAPALSERNETELERCDRQLAELMQEVRVAQTGVQVLFGFLLTVPFTTRFDALTSGQRVLYFATLTLAGAAAMLLIAPTSHHRVLFRCGDKRHLVRVANRYAIAGLACVGIAMAGALVFVADVVFGSLLGASAGAIAAMACAWSWYVQPMLRRRALFARERRLGANAGSPAPQPGRPAAGTAGASSTDA